jgi:hypothetical protein
MTIVKSEIGRRNANDTKFIVPPQQAVPRWDDRARLDGSNKNYAAISEKCSSYSHPQVLSSRDPATSSGEQSLNGEPSWMAGGLLAPTAVLGNQNSIFSTKFKFSFVKSNLMGRTNCGLRSAGYYMQVTRIQHTAVEPRISEPTCANS